MNLRMFVEWAKHQDSLTTVDRPVDPYLELARVMFALDGQPALFEQVIGFPGWRVVSGMCARRETFAAALQCSVPDLIARMGKALADPQTPTVLEKGLCQAVVQPPDLTQVPIPRYHPDDGGPYITSGVAVVKDPDLGRNASFHRLMLLDEQRFTARIVEGRGTHTALQRAERDLPIAIAVGCPIQVLLAASMSPSKGVDELAIAHALAPTPLARCQTVDLEVPAEAELIFEGHVTDSQANEG
ncbi:MAG: UbiD family decarboxylase, partial [Anaerolineae bacterium]